MKTVFVGLSGGVDSAVSAALLKEQGYSVVGCFIKIWQPEFTECTWREDRLDAMRVCAALKIPYREIDLSNQYRREVVEDMVTNYKNGITPNPDVLCNTKIKFGFFADWAFSKGADYVATGHYARVENRGDRYFLLRGVDTEKDQSYFLWQLTQEQLSRALFPVGALLKSDVRAYAAKINIPVARKHDSQGLCFVGDISLREFLSHYITFKEGVLMNESGDTIGTHDGAALYTRGQRHGFSPTNNSAGTPLYVVNTNIQTNTVTVSSDRARASSTIVHLSNAHVQISAPVSELCFAQVRYREMTAKVRTEKDASRHIVTFEEPRIVSAGQSLVWYANDVVQGGGVVNRCLV